MLDGERGLVNRGGGQTVYNPNPMNKKPTRKETYTLAPQIIEEYQELVKMNDLAGFKRLLGAYAAHIPREKKDELIEDFKRYAVAWRETSRRF